VAPSSFSKRQTFVLSDDLKVVLSSRLAWELSLIKKTLILVILPLLYSTYYTTKELYDELPITIYYIFFPPYSVDFCPLENTLYIFY